MNSVKTSPAVKASSGFKTLCHLTTKTINQTKSDLHGALRGRYCTILREETVRLAAATATGPPVSLGSAK